jgi:TetR/AcrR family transcriptional regulator
VPQRPSRKHQPETAIRILAAAEEAFAAHGLAGARTERIAARAGVNKGLLYYYFRGKRDLYRAVLRHLLEELPRTSEPDSASSSSFREQLTGFVNRYFDFLATHPNFPRLMQREVMESKGELDWVLRDYYRPLLEGLVHLIAEGVRRGEFRRVDPQQSALSLMGATTSYFAAPLWGRFLGRDLLEPGALEARRQALLDFLGHGLFRPERGER